MTDRQAQLFTAERCYADDRCATCELEMQRLLKPQPSGLRWGKTYGTPRWNLWLDDGNELYLAGHLTGPSMSNPMGWKAFRRRDWGGSSKRIASGTLSECAHALAASVSRAK